MNKSETNRNGGGAMDRISDLQPWVSVIGGGALAIFGLTRLLGNKRVSGGVMTAAGSALLYRGIASERSFEPIHVERSYTIMKPVSEVFAFWRNFENFPKFMSHLESVVVTGDRWSHWVARGPMGSTVSWHAEIIDEQPNRHIVWRSKDDSTIQTRGSVQFREAPGDRGTEVIVALQYMPPAGKVGDAVAAMLGHSAEQKIREDLRHMKQLLEAGEIPTTEGQPSGERSMLGKAANVITAEPRRRGAEFAREQQPA